MSSLFPCLSCLGIPSPTPIEGRSQPPKLHETGPPPKDPGARICAGRHAVGDALQGVFLGMEMNELVRLCWHSPKGYRQGGSLKTHFSFSRAAVVVLNFGNIEKLNALRLQKKRESSSTPPQYPLHLFLP